jgi:hypothetical protein
MAGQRPLVTNRLRVYTWPIKFYAIFLIFLFFIFGWKFAEWARAFGRMGVQHPHFLKLAPTLGSVKHSFPHGDWRFHFFSNFTFPESRVHLDLHIHRWDFRFTKN